MAVPQILCDQIDYWASQLPDHPVVTFVDVEDGGDLSSRRFTYSDLSARGGRLAAALAQTGVGPGDTFALMLDNQVEFVDAMVASSMLGAAYVPVDPRTRGEKLAYILKRAECRGVISAPQYAANVDEARRIGRDFAGFAWSTTESAAEAGSGWSALDAVVEAAGARAAKRPVDPSDLMQIVFTSGTTGDPKGIVMTHERFAAAASNAGLFGYRPGDRPYAGLSMTHANAQALTLGVSLATAMEAFISRRFTKSRLWEIVRTFRCTSFNLLGGIITALLAEPPSDDDRRHEVRYVLSSGMPKEVWKTFAARFGVDIFEFYGTAEGGYAFNPPGVGPIGSCGKPPPFLELSIRGEDDRAVASGEPGEICFRPADGTPPVVTYFGDPEASAAKTRGGWLRTGDVGVLDAGGWLTFLFRAGGGIRRNGEFIIPQHVERVLAALPQVSDVFVYGVPAESRAPGESDIVAALVTVPGNDLDLNALARHLEAELERNARPTWLQIVDMIPKTISEKPIERLLRDKFADGDGRILRLDRDARYFLHTT